MNGTLKPLILFLLFIAAFMLMTGIYEQKLKVAQEDKKIEYRFIPRTFYEEQLAKTNTVSDKVGNIFENESPWYDRTLGVYADQNITK